MVTVVIGVGPGLGERVARRFAAEGESVALLARSAEYLDEVATTVTAETDGRALAVPTDVTDETAVSDAFETIRAELGTVETLISTVFSTETTDNAPSETTVADLRAAWTVSVEGVFRCIRTALADLRDTDGTVIVTNSPLAVSPSASSLARSTVRPGMRAMCRTLAEDLGLDGVQVAHVIVDGWIPKPSLREEYPEHDDWMNPTEIADVYLDLVEQSSGAWVTELDLRAGTDDVSF